MWRRLTQWMKRLRPPGRGNRVADATRAKLMGVYLDQANASSRLRESTDDCQERLGGKFAQKRNRD